MSAKRKNIAGWSIRWDQKLADQAYADGLWAKETLTDTLGQRAAKHPEHIVIIDGDVHVTAAELYQQAQYLSQHMMSVMPVGSVVSFMLPNWHEAATIYLAATMAGMVAHPVLPSLREHDLRYMLEDIGSRMIFIPQEFRGNPCADMLCSVQASLSKSLDVVVVRGQAGPHISYESLFTNSTSTSLPDVDPDGVRMVMYTSGTTGSPKGVMHSHNSIRALIHQLGEHWHIAANDRFLVASPISHIGGSIYAFECPILLGCTAVLMERWDAEAAMDIMIREKISHFAGATPFLVQLLAAAELAETHLPDLKVFICGGASVPPALIRRASAYFDSAVVTRVYGSTEVPVMTVGVTDPGDADHAADTDGLPGIAHLKLSSSEGAAADTGEIVAKGPQMLIGYVHAEDEAKVFDTDGYFRSGDLGRWIDERYLVIAGRLKDIIIRNGENIAPKEVEDLLLGHPAIAEIAIVGLPDDKTGERACAVIVGAGDEKITLKDIQHYLIDKGIAKFKIPEQIEFVTQLLKNDAGKILKHKIRDALLAKQNG
ncbi:AMP-binding protein [Zhongshania aquimaris]|uniref:AMP-binding protein n=1 Tax=Zhongshania aquimaris TaxID=2857107 RepID=A0ABS6VWM1_9GAMM|nr:AMP-binding protein [Zhongshania aquimaris]